MPRNISPLAVRMQVSGARQGRNEVRQFGESFDVVKQKSDESNRSLEKQEMTVRQLVKAGHQIGVIGDGLNESGQAATGATRRIAEMNGEIEKGEKQVRSLGQRVREVGSDFKDLTQHAAKTVGEVHKVWEVVGALRAKSPFKLFDAAVPEATKRKIGGGMIAGGVALSAMLGTTISPAMTKESQLTSITALANNSRAAADDIYKATDDASVESVFNLPELVGAAKTLTKDRQFSTRYLRAADDLAATDPELFNPQDAARAFGRIKVGDTGEGLERLADMGLSKQDLKDKGIKFDESGAVADKTPEGIQKLLDAIIATIEERFGGLSEKLATTTLAGSLSNAQDAVGRLATSIGETFIPILNFSANTVRALATWINSLPGPIKSVIAWGTALGAGLLILGGGFLMVGGAIAKVILIWRGLNFICGLFGTSLTKLAFSMVARAIPATLAMGVTMLGLAAAVGLLLYVSKMYWDELQHGTKTVEDARDAEAKKNDDRSADAVRQAVKDSASLSDKDRYSVLKAAITKASQLGDTALADEIEKERLPLAQKLRKQGIDTGDAMKKAETAAGQQLVDRINSQAANNKAARLSAVDYLPAKSQADGPSLQDLQTGAWVRTPKVDDGGTTLTSGISGPMTVGTAEAELRAQQPAEVQQAQGSVDALTSEIQDLQDQKRRAGDKDTKAAIQETIIQKQRQLGSARRELSAQKTLSARQEREAKAAERAAKKKGELDEKDERMLAKLDSDAAFEDRIVDLEEQLDKAKEDADAKKVRALTLQIARLKAEQQYSEDIIAARDEDDPSHKKALEMAAKKKRDIANVRAVRAADKAAAAVNKDENGKKKKLSPAEIAALFRTTTGGGPGAVGFSFPALNPTGTAGAGDRFDGLAPSLWGRSIDNGFSQGIPGIGDFTGEGNRRAMEQERIARVKRIKREGKRLVVKFEDIEFEDEDSMADAEVDR